ncbi:MAG TPA: hypothetical protein VND64_09260 [Pirellulales bacterium]|nr:hypothetical protein [Pirellulales bacterium]
MRAFRTVLCIAVVGCGCAALAGEGAIVRFATARTRQPIVETPLPEETELVPPSNAKENRDDADDVPDEKVRPGTPSGAASNPFDYGTMTGTGLPAAPYKAGLSYMQTPQPFRVPYPNRFYYPCPHFVRRCPYFPKGVYWGANWNRVYLPPNNLIHGAFRFNPYLSNRIAQKQGNCHHHNHCPPVVDQAVPSNMKHASVEQPEKQAVERPDKQPIAGPVERP